MIAWYGEQKLKDAAMERLREHQRLDAFVQGTYFESGRGCHLGCLTHSNTESHHATERMFGIETRIAYWLEAVFEGLPKNKCAQWVIDSTDAIPVSADLSRCHHVLAVWLLGPESPSAIGNQHELVASAVAAVRSLHERTARGEGVSEDEWSAAVSAARSAAWSAVSAAVSAAWSAWSAESAARSAARSAAESAAWSAVSAAVSAAWSAWSAESAARSAARSAAESAAWSAWSAWSAESAARSAARSAAESAAWSAWSAESAARSARSAAWESIAEKSIEIFRNAPVRIAGPEEECEQCVREAMVALSSPIVV